MPVIIRQWKENDLKDLVLHANNINIWNTLRNYFPHPYTDVDGREWIKQSATMIPSTSFAIDIGDPVGGIGVFMNKMYIVCPRKQRQLMIPLNPTPLSFFAK